jgi:hypothetical protein
MSLLKYFDRVPSKAQAVSGTGAVTNIYYNDPTEIVNIDDDETETVEVDD